MAAYLIDTNLAKTARLEYNGPQQPNKGQGRNPALFCAIIYHTSEAETGE